MCRFRFDLFRKWPIRLFSSCVHWVHEWIPWSLSSKSSHSSTYDCHRGCSQDPSRISAKPSQWSAICLQARALPIQIQGSTGWSYDRYCHLRLQADLHATGTIEELSLLLCAADAYQIGRSCWYSKAAQSHHCLLKPPCSSALSIRTLHAYAQQVSSPKAAERASRDAQLNSLWSQ